MRRLLAAAILVYVGVLLAEPRFETWPDPPPPVPGAEEGPLEAWREMDADVLADVALGEDPDAVEAVAWTVLNRARLSGRLVEQEVQDGHAYGSVVGDRWVPSWRRAPGRRWRGAPWEWRRAVETALRVLRGEVPDPTRGATHFHRHGTWAPPWAPAPSQWEDVGQHHFYVPRVSG